MGKDDEMTFTTYYDSNQGDNLDERKLTIGYVVFFLDNAIVVWNNRQQPIMALSTTETKYMAISKATKKTMWL